MGQKHQTTVRDQVISIKLELRAFAYFTSAALLELTRTQEEILEVVSQDEVLHEKVQQIVGKNERGALVSATARMLEHLNRQLELDETDEQPLTAEDHPVSQLLSAIRSNIIELRQ